MRPWTAGLFMGDNGADLKQHVSNPPDGGGPFCVEKVTGGGAAAFPTEVRDNAGPCAEMVVVLFLPFARLSFLMERKHIAILPIVLVLAYVAFQYLSAPKVTNPETGSVHRIAPNMGAQQQQALGLQAYQQVLQKEGGNVISSGPEVDQVTRVVRRLASAAMEKSKLQYQWRVSVIRSSEVNAFCLPGGEIVVYTAILPLAGNDAGLATVLGHEMAHATSQHGAQRMFDQQLTQTALVGVQSGLSNMDPQQQQQVMSALGMGAQYGLSLPFSRDQESEADHIGLLYMARAGYDPHEALAFWKRMNAQAGSRQPPQFASDHPSNGQRIQQIEGWMPAAEKEYDDSTMKDTKQPTQNTGL